MALSINSCLVHLGQAVLQGSALLEAAIPYKCCSFPGSCGLAKSVLTRISLDGKWQHQSVPEGAPNS